MAETEGERTTFEGERGSRPERDPFASGDDEEGEEEEEEWDAKGEYGEGGGEEEERRVLPSRSQLETEKKSEGTEWTISREC